MGGTQDFSTTVIPKLRSAFQVGREEHNNFSYVGIDFVTVYRKVKIHQESYSQHMQPIPMDPSRAVEQDSPLCEKEKDQLRSKIGQILWVARQSRPDVMFDASNLASGMKNATVQTIHEANRIVCKIKSKKVSLNFHYLGRDSALKMIVVSDASFGKTLHYSDGRKWKILTPFLAIRKSQEDCAACLQVKHWQCLTALIMQSFSPHSFLN